MSGPKVVRSLIVVASALILGIACSEGGFADRPDTGGFDQDAPDEVDAGNDSGGDTGPEGPPPVEARTSCSAGGISTGGGVRAVQCYGPVEISGREASGEGVTWQSGGFRVISEGAN